MLAVDFQEAEARVPEFWDERDLTMPVLLDGRGAVFEQYRLVGLPDSCFVDRDGILRTIH